MNREEVKVHTCFGQVRPLSAGNEMLKNIKDKFNDGRNNDYQVQFLSLSGFHPTDLSIQGMRSSSEM